MITRKQLTDDLTALGLKPGDVVMVHSSLSALGPVAGGADTVVDALLEAIGPTGTVIAPAFRDSVWGEPENFTCTDCDCSNSDGLCHSRQPGFQGIIPEKLRQRADTVRSCHPTHSWVALGPAAAKLCKDHRDSPTPCGRGNPFEALVRLDGVVLILGVQVNAITLWHYYEEILCVPYLGHYWPKQRHLNHCVPGKRIQYEFPGIMQDVCRASGILRTGPVGKGSSGIIRSRDFESFMATIMADDPSCMILRPPDRDSDDLALDALNKGAAMLRAWAQGPAKAPKSFEVQLAPIDPFADRAVERADCPAYLGRHDADGRKVALCSANGIHPDLVQYGGEFRTSGPALCETCPWHQKYPDQPAK